MFYYLLALDYEILEFIDDRVVMAEEIYNHFPRSSKVDIDERLYLMSNHYLNTDHDEADRIGFAAPAHNLLERCDFNNYRLTSEGASVLYDYRVRKRQAFHQALLAWATIIVSLAGAVLSAVPLLERFL